MARDLIYSLVLHAGVIALTFMASPFEIRGRDSYDEVIHVSLYAAPPPAEVAVETVAPPPEPITVATPPPVEEDEPDIPVGEPETKDEAVIEEQPEKEPEPAPEKPPVQTTVEQPVRQQSPQGASSDAPSEIHSPATAGSSPFAGATINNAAFDYPYWFTQAFNKVRGHWRNPVSSDAPLVCAIYFEVIKSGRVIVARIEKSSGIRVFDEACLRAVNESAPFPPLPRQFTDEIIGITLPFKGVPGT